jgi:murein DD-endopeptidase MepM/ murein hydrolase activator NlpD
MKTLLAALLLAASSARAAEGIYVGTIPPVPLIEEGRSSQLLNFDLLVTNQTSETLELSMLQATVLGPNDALVTQKRLDTNGDSSTMSILTIPNRVLAPGAKLVVFNPFPAHDLGLDLSRIRYELVFDAGETAAKYHAATIVASEPYRTKTDLVLPLSGRIFAHDAHDLYAHHRRLDITGGMTTALGITANFMRYSYDFVIVDEQGRMYKNDGETNEDWFGFGVPVTASGSGVVVAAHDGIADNTKSKKAAIDRDAVMKNVFLILGNHVMVDHGNGEYSFFAHLKNGSVSVKPGDRVRQGQKLGEMGFSGDAFLVHLHYQLQSDAAFGEGLPSQFRDFQRYTGKAWLPVKRGTIDSGDVVSKRNR